MADRTMTLAFTPRAFGSPATTAGPLDSRLCLPPSDATTDDGSMNAVDATTEFVFTQVILGSLADRRIRKSATYVRSMQLAHGGWSRSCQSQPDLDLSIKAYTVLRLSGDLPTSPSLSAARQVIAKLGDWQRSSGRTRLFLAALGVCPWEVAPSLPIDGLLQPSWSPFSLDRPSSWIARTLLPIAVVASSRPLTPLPAELVAREIISRADRRKTRVTGRLLAWHNMAPLVDRAFKVMERLGALPTRRQAWREAETWILESLDSITDVRDLLFGRLALRCLGHTDASPAVQKWDEKLRENIVEDRQSAFVRRPTLPGRFESESPSKAPLERVLAAYAEALGLFAEKNPSRRSSARQAA